MIYNNAISDIKHITHGVSKGSILGPLLFISYVDDFSRISSRLFSILFADDTSVLIEGKMGHQHIKQRTQTYGSTQINLL